MSPDGGAKRWHCFSWTGGVGSAETRWLSSGLYRMGQERRSLGLTVSGKFPEDGVVGTVGFWAQGHSGHGDGSRCTG